ncbi:MAG TPA: hypothetical protein DIS53_01935 [Candidatus Wildermuthbacteria bacterium]|uniref:Prepilin-type N-terminal cleavage/methylation domain-containing protein n=2 Tax=Parcubacteria group TaxID=1794811 RepID=A0A837IM46_9BACT|nr:MAG: hypothetical protein UY25_C0001G0128 [Candidatus Yanofskybacteria bacterium GW2011_GWC1_48_11]KKW03897.1 MAG: hypothetical protein UY38_C0002G0051 [Parcubacteria group bacterium GW2011_GWB1_49_12]KKW08541.1 MAG: hypothetical protein UY45_C0006G0027 [Parcubacteria group bacterium GW2011_GWA1_49_26]KKW14018.1 MAG: hypothetical protein UY53_C0004G0069 [Parcubacteria group bacterium GW2011_GWA2_50_10]HCM36673.1 hypothetical protein [Candidatus Wildermuthbacteria bacterium]
MTPLEIILTSNRILPRLQHMGRGISNGVKGLTLVEILVVFAIFGLLLGSSVVGLTVLRGGADLEAEARGLSRVLELARNRTIASEGAARYGVYVDTSVAPHRYVLFQGDDYLSRVSEEVYQLRDTIEFGAVSFGGGQEVVFNRIQGTTGNPGSAILRGKADPANARTVYVGSSGAVEIDSGAAPNDDDRVKDSRHVHIDYTRNPPIDTATEELILDFGTATEVIAISDYLAGGQIVWEGTIEVDGEEQKLKIHTHVLNSGFDSQFSVHRNRRLNTKPLSITLSGDITGKLIEYAADGEIISGGESIYVSAVIPQ